MAKTTLNDMRTLVEGCREFEGNSVFGKWINGGEMYCVYSYGFHFPMYIYDPAIKEWIGNSDKYSTTTSRHQSKCRPSDVKFWLDTKEMLHLIAMRGFVQYKTAREV